MRKNHKKALGLLGLSAVAGMTAVAASLPTPVGAAASTSDIITITVVSDNAEIFITSPQDGAVTDDGEINVKFQPSNLGTATAYLVYTKDGTSVQKLLHSYTFSRGDNNKPVEFLVDVGPKGLNLGEGDYSILIKGVGAEYGNVVERAVGFTYKVPDIPTTGDPEVPDVPKTGNELLELNISRADYLITGILVFGFAVMGASIIFAKKKNQRH